MESMILKGQTALVTGGSGAIGSASAMSLMLEGATVVLLGRRLKKLNETREALLAKVPSGQVEVYSADALNPEEMQQAFEFTSSLQNRLDIVVSTVGGGTFKPLLMSDLGEFRDEVDVNISSAFLAVRYGVPHMTSGGSIVFISSTAGGIAFPWLTAYCAGKAGLEAFVRSAADELASAGVRINAVRSGLVPSEVTRDIFAHKPLIEKFLKKIPLQRVGLPQDLAAGVRYLAGPESSWVTGQIFNIDGGQGLRGYPDMKDEIEMAYGKEALNSVLAGKSFPAGKN